ncbi:MAG TPA: hypothetical protein VK582_09320 [Pyrinomonadaceae bacterium]|nr:hypothetical protein [Pyrinomonadaceae bacterium]
MSADQVSSELARWPFRVQLRELNGFDEQSVCRTDTATAISLLDRLLMRGAGSVSEDFKAINLTASERDRLLACVYEQTFGPRIESTSYCNLCQSPFDLTFTIESLLAAFDPSSSSTATATPERDGAFRLPGGLRFRLPTGADELAAAGLPLKEAELVLLKRCVLDSEEDIDPEAVQQAMSDLAPVLDVDLNAECPECGAKQSVRFDVQFYLLRALEQQRKQIAREVHRLAVAYGWSLNEILGLSRSQRKAFVEFIEAEFS